MYKFRSMEVQSPEEEKKGWTTRNDPRVTRVGHFIRKTSLDEFPQFLNILKGDISFIGPRPKLYCPEKYPNGLPEYMKKSFTVKPGVTGYAQAYYRNSITNEEKFKWDGYYAENISFMMDVKIIFKTIKSVLFRENINTEQSYKK